MTEEHGLKKRLSPKSGKTWEKVLSGEGVGDMNTSYTHGNQDQRRQGE
jgi:hypothetical protein